MNPSEGLKDMSFGLLKEFQAGKRQIIQDNGQEFIFINILEYCRLHTRLCEKDREIKKLKEKSKRR